MSTRALTPFQLLELNVISAQDLAAVARSMRTYAVAWIHPDRKLSTRVDTYGHQNPTWNDKFVFRVDEEFLYADTSAITIDIYALHWFKDIYVGSVRVLISNLITPPSRPFQQGSNPSSSGMRFGALQVRRQSGRPQGILNIGVAVLDSSMRSMPLYSHDSSALGYRHLMGEEDAFGNHNHLSPRPVPKPELRRAKSDTSSMISASVQQQRVKGRRGKPSSMLSASEDSSNKGRRKSRSRSKASSIISGSEVSRKSKGKGRGRGKSGKASSVLSEPGLQWEWRVKTGKASSTLSQSEPNNEQGKLGNPSSDSKDEDVDNKNQKQHIEKPNSLNGGSESTDGSSETTEKFNAFENPRFLQKTLNAYEVKASPKPQFRNTPGPMLHHQRPMGTPMHAAAGLGGSNKGTPMHAAVGLGGSNKGTPMHAAVGLGGSNKGTPMHAAMGLGGSNKATPMHAAMGFGGTPRGTPLHSIGRFNPAFEYATPRRSNLGGKAPPVLTESELGPSPSEVAAALAKYPMADEGENSTVGGWSLDESVEGLQSKLERWRTELPPVYDNGERSSYTPSSKKSSHNRRHTDGGNGLFSCFSNICGCQCTIVCGGGDAKKKAAAGRRRTPSVESESMV